MSRILIASWDGGGNTAPAFNLGTRLVRSRHRVRMIGWEAMAPRAAEAGIEFVTFPTVPRWPDGVVLDDDFDLLKECLFGEACRADLLDAARDFDAEILVVDCMLRAGFDAARELEARTVGLVHVSYQRFLSDWGERAMDTGVRAMLSPCDVVLALQPPGFDAPCERPLHHEYVGAIEHPDGNRPLSRQLGSMLAEPGPPWVLLSMSTTSQHGQQHTLQTALDALAGVPVRVLVTVGAQGTTIRLRPPANARISGFVPHDLLLPYMSAVITHAGMSTVAMTLAAGVPMVCMPLGRDQIGNAQRVAAIGAGVVAEPADAAAAVARLLADPSFRASAQHIAAGCVRLRRGGYAAELVSALVPAPVA